MGLYAIVNGSSFLPSGVSSQPAWEGDWGKSLLLPSKAGGLQHSPCPSPGSRVVLKTRSHWAVQRGIKVPGTMSCTRKPRKGWRGRKGTQSVGGGKEIGGPGRGGIHKEREGKQRGVKHPAKLHAKNFRREGGSPAYALMGQTPPTGPPPWIRLLPTAQVPALSPPLCPMSCEKDVSPTYSPQNRHLPWPHPRFLPPL